MIGHSSNSNVIKYNNVENNVEGIHLQIGDEDNIICLNNFKDNRAFVIKS